MNTLVQPSAEDARSPRELGIRFTGSGSEYFRIWIVNLLLIVVTLGLYIPFARARRIRYFYANTLVDGQALAFHGNPWRMFRGFLLLLVLAGAYSGAGQISPAAAGVAFVLLCVIWPALWRSALRFRLGNTSWRGLRFAFRGDLTGAYKAVLPVYLTVLPLVLMPLLVGKHRPEDMPGWVGALYLVLSMAWLLFWPWGLALIKRYQHRGYTLGHERADIDLSTGSMYGLVFKGFGMCLLIGIVAGVLVAGIAAAAIHGGPESAPGRAALTFAPLFAAYLLAFLIVGCWGTSRLQNMVWSGTHSQHLRFSSVLRARSYMGLCLKNAILTVLTVGLYRPFAVISATRMRVEAVGVDLSGSYEYFMADTEASYQDATGDASGDFFGIDLGL